MKDIMKYVVYAGLFAVPFLTLYVANDYFFPYITGKNFGFRIIIDIVFAAWVVLAFYEVKYRPKVSGIVTSFGVLLIVMFLADWFGENRTASFWSNFERMDGYVSLVHTFLYMLVLSAMLQTKQQWKYLLNTSLVVAFFVALYGLAQFSGQIEGFNATRIDSTLGNAAYMAVYMLFHVFIAFWLFVETKGSPVQKSTYGILILMFTYVLIETGTRGTAIGLAVGVMVMAAYIGFFGKQFREYRKYTIGAFAILILAVGVFVKFKDTAVIQSSPNLARIANISLDDLRIRGIIWGMAWDGVKEKPLLGYGQSNFNYVFNEKYDSRLYAQEQWFDRSHNIIMDWLVTGGFLGLLAYLSIFGACIYYLLVRPILNKDDETFDVMERGVLLGILAGYFTHNLVVFDNIVSYIFFAIILGLINARVGVMPKAVETFKLDKAIINQFVAPVMAVLLVSTIYFWHAPGMAAASDIILAFRAQDPGQRLAIFEQAIDRNSFAHQEITEQISQQAMNMLGDKTVPQEVKDNFAKVAEEQLNRLESEKPGDARVEVFIGTYYRATGNLDLATKHMALARSLSPNKASIVIQQGFIALTQGDYKTTRDFMQTAFELDKNNLEAREYYAASLFYVNEPEAAMALMDSEEAKARFAQSDFLLGAANQVEQKEFMVELFEYRVNAIPDAAKLAQNWASLSFLYYQMGLNDKAVETLEKSKVAVPGFASTATCIIGNIETGIDPQTPCQ